MRTKLWLENLKPRHSRRVSTVTHSHVVLLLLQHCGLVLVDTCNMEFCIFETFNFYYGRNEGA